MIVPAQSSQSTNLSLPNPHDDRELVATKEIRTQTRGLYRPVSTRADKTIEPAGGQMRIDVPIPHDQSPLL